MSEKRQIRKYCLLTMATRHADLPILPACSALKIRSDCTARHDRFKPSFERKAPQSLESGMEQRLEAKQEREENAEGIQIETEEKERAWKER